MYILNLKSNSGISLCSCLTPPCLGPTFKAWHTFCDSVGMNSSTTLVDGVYSA